jgi:hypothetical protein
LDNDFFIKKIRKMQQTLDITRTSRTIVSQMLAGYTLDQLNTIQEGYSNNLMEYYIIVVQQMLVYKLSGLPMMISDEMVEKYKGTKPEILQLKLRSMKSNYYLWKPSIRLKAI